jgi:hypothetical protein
MGLDILILYEYCTSEARPSAAAFGIFVFRPSNCPHRNSQPPQVAVARVVVPLAVVHLVARVVGRHTGRPDVVGVVRLPRLGLGWQV